MMMSFVIYPESIIMGFLKGFFMQETLFNNIPNPFLFTDGKSQSATGGRPSIAIEMSESELVNAVPAIFIQEGGFTEDLRAIGHNDNIVHLLSGSRQKLVPLLSPITLHCVGSNKGEAKLLQAIVALAIMSFRTGIYELGIDNISPLQGGPPMRMTRQDKQGPSQTYDCTIMFQVLHHQEFLLSTRPHGNVDIEEKIAFTVYNALKNIEFDEDCNPIAPTSEWFKLQLDIGE